MRSQKIAAAAAVCGLLLVGCTTDTAARDSAVEFDYELGRIRLPLDDYLGTSPEDIAAFVAAREVATAECLKKAGFQYHLPSAAELLKPGYDDDRRYGIWDVEHAKTFGWKLDSSGHLPPAATVVSTDALPALEKCQEGLEVTLIDIGVFDSSTEISRALMINDETRAQAEADPKWVEANNKWGECLERRGLTYTEGSLLSNEAEALLARGVDEASPEEIRLATIEAECNQEVQMAQTMADIEAGYQTTAIRENEAVLNVELAQVSRQREAATTYVREHAS
ncbi:hypothetical protein PV375_06570 [Gulosibacter sp. GYB002]|uniref:hypothetical protein n=1 Tax=Gulosibacter sp. GYB002 TaxID=2994391 RepID=UPI002F96387F